jgi:hypothetical protein
MTYGSPSKKTLPRPRRVCRRWGGKGAGREWPVETRWSRLTGSSHRASAGPTGPAQWVAADHRARLHWRRSTSSTGRAPRRPWPIWIGSPGVSGGAHEHFSSRRTASWRGFLTGSGQAAWQNAARTGVGRTACADSRGVWGVCGRFVEDSRAAAVLVDVLAGPAALERSLLRVAFWRTMLARLRRAAAGVTLPRGRQRGPRRLLAGRSPAPARGAPRGAGRDRRGAAAVGDLLQLAGRRAPRGRRSGHGSPRQPYPARGSRGPRCLRGVPRGEQRVGVAPRAGRSPADGAAGGAG